MTKLVHFDWAMKYLLRNKANFDVLEGFLSELLKTDIKIETIIESESNKTHENDKFNRVDLIAKTQQNERIIVEVQCSRQLDYLSRVLYGTSKLITGQLTEGTPYKNICKVISVSIIYFNLGGEGKDYIYHGTMNIRGIHEQDPLCLSPEELDSYKPKSKAPADIFPEYYFIKVNQFRETIKDKLDEWMYFFRNGTIKSDFNAKGIQIAAKKLDVLSLNEQERRAYEADKEDLHFQASMVMSHYGRGKTDGQIEMLSRVILRFLELKFEYVPESYRQQIANADIDFLNDLLERLFACHSLEEIFRDTIEIVSS